jgi:hypothetical protein
VLESEESLEFLDLLDEEYMPKHSDVVLMLSQYVAAMTAFHDRYFRYHNSRHQWVTE